MSREKRRLPRKVRNLLEEAIAAASLERCGVDPEAQEKMKCYLDTWVVMPLHRIWAWDEGKVSTEDI